MISRRELFIGATVLAGVGACSTFERPIRSWLVDNSRPKTFGMRRDEGKVFEAQLSPVVTRDGRDLEATLRIKPSNTAGDITKTLEEKGFEIRGIYKARKVFGDAYLSYDNRGEININGITHGGWGEIFVVDKQGKEVILGYVDETHITYIDPTKKSDNK